MGREGDGESAFVALERTLIGALQVVLLAWLSCVWLVALWGSLSLKLSFNARKQDTLSIGQPGALLRTENTLRSQLRDCSYTCSECITTLHWYFCSIRSRLPWPSHSVAAAAEISLKGAWARLFLVQTRDN